MSVCEHMPPVSASHTEGGLGLGGGVGGSRQQWGVGVDYAVGIWPDWPPSPVGHLATQNHSALHSILVTSRLCILTSELLSHGGGGGFPPHGTQ